MDNNIHITPESIGKFKAISDEPSPEGYESPITGYISQLSRQIIEQRESAVVAQINEQIGVNVDKTELIRALNYDRNQFNEGYKKGYRDAQEKYEEADRWIPVSERTPNDLEPVNITWINHEPEPYYKEIKGIPFTATGVYFNGQWYWWSTLCIDTLAEYSHNYDDIIDKAIEVTAWKPLPKPYIEPLPDYADEYIREKLGESEEEE